MQKTGWTIHSPFLVLFGLKKNFTLDVITRGQATTIFLCIGPFSAWSRTTEQPGDPRASLLLTSVRRQSFAIRRRSKGERQDSGGASANDVKVINTSAFINTKIDYGLYFVFHLMDSVTLTIISLIDNGVSGFAWGADACPCLPQFGWRPVDPLSSDQLAGKTSLIFLDSKDLAVTGKQNIYCCINSFQPRCWPTPVSRASMA